MMKLNITENYILKINGCCHMYHCKLVDTQFHRAKVGIFSILDLEKVDISVSELKTSGNHGWFWCFVGGPATE